MCLLLFKIVLSFKRCRFCFIQSFHLLWFFYEWSITFVFDTGLWSTVSLLFPLVIDRSVTNSFIFFLPLRSHQGQLVLCQLPLALRISSPKWNAHYAQAIFMILVLSIDCMSNWIESVGISTPISCVLDLSSNYPLLFEIDSLFGTYLKPYRTFCYVHIFCCFSFFFVPVLNVVV